MKPLKLLRIITDAGETMASFSRISKVPRSTLITAVMQHQFPVRGNSEEVMKRKICDALATLGVDDARIDSAFEIDTEADPIVPKEKDTSGLRLRIVLQQHGIQQQELAHSLGISEAAVSNLVGKGIWPKSSGIADDIRSFLRSKGVPPDDVDTAFDSLSPQQSFKTMEPAMLLLSQRAKQHFKLLGEPFKDDVNSADDVYANRHQAYIRESMLHAARTGGFLAVIGESGAGKSTLRRDLIDRIRREKHKIIVLQPEAPEKNRLSAAHIQDAVIQDLNGEQPRRSLEAKGRQVKQLLVDSARAGNSHVLMIEEAHDLNIMTLKYLKRFWEMEDGFRRLLGIILVGQPELADMLDIQRNYRAREVIQRCEVAVLQPLNGDLEKYLEFKFNRINADVRKIFDQSAYDALRERLTVRGYGNQVHSELYPLRVHNEVTRLMNQAAELGYALIDAELVGMVVSQATRGAG